MMEKEKTMRRSTLAALAVLALAAAPLPAPRGAVAADLKVGVVDLQRALNGTVEGEAVKQGLKDKFQPKYDLLNARQKELREIDEKLKSSVLAKDAKAALSKEFEKKKADFQELAAKTQYETDRENKAASAKIIDGLYEICLKISKDEGYSLMLEKTGSGLIFFADSLDLTDRVVKIYNEKNPGGGEKKP